MEVMSDTLNARVRPITKRFQKQIDRCKNVQFEQDWQNAISGDELVKRVHQHIDDYFPPVQL